MFDELIRRDYVRLRNKGPFWLLFSIATNIGLLFGWVEASKVGYPIFLEWTNQLGLTKWQISFYSSYLVAVLCFLLFNLGFLILYYFQIPWIEKYKIMKDEKWPWVEKAEGWKATLLASLMRFSFNLFVLLPIFLYILSIGKNHEIPLSQAVEDLPSDWTLAWQITFCLYVEDIAFSLSHRLLHTQFLYKHVHKVHHSYTQTISIAAIHTHPFEYFIGNIIPSALPTLILSSPNVISYFGLPSCHLVT